jgi:hypothetical protein
VTRVLPGAIVAAAAAASVALWACGNQTWSFEADAGAPCTIDSDCTIATLHCDTSSGQCVPCVIDQQCTLAGRRVCDTALNQCVQCGVTGDCAGNLVCEPTSHTCVSSCVDGGPCPSGTSCDQSRWVCVGCTGDGDCANAPGGPVCDVGSGQCVECVLDSQCTFPKRRCNHADDHCVECLTGADCDDHVCNPATFTCLDTNDD